MSNLGRFNSQLENMLNELSKSFPNWVDIKIFREKFLIAKKVNPKLILLVFLQYIYPYKSYITNKNEKFFLDENLTNTITNDKEIQKSGEVDGEYLLTKALNLKKLWLQMNDQQKQTIWTYFQVLIFLCERYVADTMK